MMSANTSVQVEAKERPIIFGAESVRAILEGRKTQTRRVVKKPAWFDRVHTCSGTVDEHGHTMREDALSDKNGEHYKFCPYGSPLERLWVREKALYWRVALTGRPTEVAAFAADGYQLGDREVWTSPLFMARKFSRITLELTEVRVERLQDISERDAMAEGMLPIPHNAGGYVYLLGRPYAGEYATGWNKLNAKRGFGWDTNCWVWVLSFKRVQV